MLCPFVAALVVFQNSGMCVVGFPGDDLAVFPSVVEMLEMLDILVGLELKDSSQRYSWFLSGSQKMFRILRNMWFDSGFTFPRQFSELLMKLILFSCTWTLVFHSSSCVRSRRLWCGSSFFAASPSTPAVGCALPVCWISRALFSLVGRPMKLGRSLMLDQVVHTPPCTTDAMVQIA